MNIDGWRYYNHAMIPTCAPHEEPDLSAIQNGTIWKNRNGDKVPLLARWTTEFDCKETTNWWYVIADKPFDITKLRAKRRYEINKGKRNFQVRRLEKPWEYAEELCDVQAAAFSAYPEKYRPTVNRASFINKIHTWDQASTYVYGAFFRETNCLCGYAYLTETGAALNFSVLKTRPEYEKYAVNAAIVNKIMEDFADKLNGTHYICDGARSIQHETAFQDYLEKYFAFRKAYCRLHVKYNPLLAPVILLLYRFRALFRYLDGIGMIHSMNGLFAMQEIVEEQEKDNE